MSSSTATVNLSAVGVDVGFFSTKYTLGTRDKRSGSIEVRQFPSVAPRVSNALKDLTAKDSLDGAMIEVDSGVRHFVGQDAYQLMTTTGARAVTSDYCTTSDYKALFRGALFHIARAHKATDSLTIDTLVAGLPLSTVYTHSKELERFIAGEHLVPSPAGADKSLRVVIRNAMVIAQPQGALIAHGVDGTRSMGGDFNTLVLDMGGGTFDWFVARGVKPNRALCGAVSIGALACSAAICDEIKPGLKENPEIMARVDKALREGSPVVLISGVEHQMASFNAIIQRVLADAIEQMRKSVGSLDSIDKILVTGGGAHLMQSALAEAIPQYANLIEVDKEPVASNVRGFHSLAEYQASAR